MFASPIRTSASTPALLRRSGARLAALVAAATCVGICAAGPASADSAPAESAGVPVTLSAPAVTAETGTAAAAGVSPAADVEPATTEPAATEPATTEPATTEPATTEPATTEPAITEPATTEPAIQPVVPAQPTPAQIAPPRGSAVTSRTAVSAAAVATKPVVTTQPVETWVDLGTSATFTAHASGTPTPTVQWQFRRWTEDVWVDIPGATSDSYTSPPASVSDVEPGFRAIFTNTAGSVATQSADLRVNQAPPAAGTPSAPRNVKARQTAPGQITITWSAPADEGTSPITSYGAGYGTRRWGNGDDFSPSTFTAVFNDIDDGDYSAVVFAVNDSGLGWRVFVPISVGDVPTAPRHVAAKRSGTSVTVTWGAPARAGYAPVVGYEVVLTSGANRLTRTVSPSATSATFRDLPPGTWRVRVTASNIVGPGSAGTVSFSVPSSAPATPAAPSTPAARPASAIPAVAPAAAPAAQLALTGSESAVQAALALGLVLLGLASTTAARRLRTRSQD